MKTEKKGFIVVISSQHNSRSQAFNIKKQKFETPPDEYDIDFAFNSESQAMAAMVGVAINYHIEESRP